MDQRRRTKLTFCEVRLACKVGPLRGSGMSNGDDTHPSFAAKIRVSGGRDRDDLPLSRFQSKHVHIIYIQSLLYKQTKIKSLQLPFPSSTLIIMDHSAIQFSSNPDLISRATIFVRRELRVWDALDVEVCMLHTLISTRLPHVYSLLTSCHSS